MSRDGAARLVVVQSSEGDPKRSGQHRPTMLTIEGDSNVANSARQVTLERSPVQVMKRLFHGNVITFKNKIDLRISPEIAIDRVHDYRRTGAETPERDHERTLPRALSRMTSTEIRISRLFTRHMHAICRARLKN
jgi:hypothetical protein